MAAGERNKNGKATDVVCHYVRNITDSTTLCGRTNFGYRTDATAEVTCMNCMNKLLNKAAEIATKTKGLFV